MHVPQELLLLRVWGVGHSTTLHFPERDASHNLECIGLSSQQSADPARRAGDSKGAGQILHTTSKGEVLKRNSLFFAATARNQGNVATVCKNQISFFAHEAMARERETPWPLSGTHCQ